MRFVILIILMILANGAFAEVVNMTDATWKSCKGQSCYALSVERAGTTALMPSNLFVKNIRLNLYKSLSATEPTDTVLADHGFFMEKQNRWVLVKAHKSNSQIVEDMYFNPSQLTLVRATF